MYNFLTECEKSNSALLVKKNSIRNTCVIGYHPPPSLLSPEGSEDDSCGNDLFGALVDLSSCERLRPNEARVKMLHEVEITFLLAYQTIFFIRCVQSLI